jgi:uncharacterized protein (TIGR02594 family)
MPEAPKSLADIRADQLSQAQSAIDATQALFAEQQRQIQATGASQLAQTSSNLVGAGLAGSPFAQTGEAGVQQNTQYQLNAQAAQRSSDISGIMQQAEANAQNLYQQAIENYRSDRDFAVSERDSAMAQERLATQDAEAKQEAAKEASKSTILNLAESGYSLDEMNPQEYKALLANSGMTDFEAHAIWSANSPEANAEMTVQNGMIVQTYFDPHTGKPVVKTTALPPELASAATPPDIATQVLADGSVIFYDKAQPFDENGNLKTIKYSGSDITKPVEGEGLGYDAPTVKTFGGQDYQWDSSIGDWTPVEVPGSGLSEQAKKAQNILDIITSLKSDDAVLNNAVGPISNMLPTLRGETADFEEKLKTLQSLLTLDNIGLLKGVLSDTDMKILQSAGSSLSLRMSETGFKAELDRIAEKLTGAVGVAGGADSGFAAYAPDENVVNALTNKVKVDAEGNALSEGEIDAMARYATKLYKAGKSAQEVTDALNSLLRGEAPSDFSQGVSAPSNSSPLEVAKSYLGMDAGSPKQAKTLSAFFKKAGGVDLDPATTAWCAAFANSVLGAAGIKGTGSTMAQSFLKLGTAVKKPTKGDIVVFERGAKGSGLGHVGFVVGINKNGTLQVLGGNQSNKTSIETFKTDRVLGYRRINSVG